jgi:NAD(P)-dependent dehydrogenase (short-subunit alcohol dehydrogenase family)
MQLALAGAFVVAHYDAADESSAHVIRQLEEIGTLGRGVAGDLTTAAGAVAVVAQVEALYGRLDMLVNVAQPVESVAFEDVSESVWRDGLGATLDSALWSLQAAARLLRARPSPCVVNVMPELPGVAGVTARAGLVGLTQYLAEELAPRVRVNGVAVQGQPPPDETARACYYLLSSEAKYLTGQILTIKERL